MSVVRRIGLLAGREPALCQAFLERARRQPGIEAEMVTIGGVPERSVSRYDVIVDRLSHRLPHYRSYLQAAVLAGSSVINDPFRASGSDKFFALSLAGRLGLEVPRAVLLPHKSYGPDVAPAHDLGNLQYPLDWQAIVHYVGFPALLRPVRSEAPATLVHDFAGLMAAFDAAGERLVMLQQHLPEARSMRALCVGEQVAVAGAAEPFRERAAEAATALARALGYDLCGVSFALARKPAGGDEALYLLDGDVPAPEIESLGDQFDAVVDWLVSLAVARARSGERTIDRQAFGPLLRS